MTDDELIAYTETWIRSHEKNKYQREAAQRMKMLVAALRKHSAPAEPARQDFMPGVIEALDNLMIRKGE